MKKITTFILMLVLYNPFFVMAEEELSCEDLSELAEVLDEVADVLSETEVSDIRGDQSFDRQLGELIEALQTVAEIEENDGLSDNVDAMERVWDTEGEWTKSEWNELRRALDSVINSFGRIHYRDCKR